MSNNRHHLPINLLKLLDALLVVCSFGVATVLMIQAQNKTSLTTFLTMRTRISNFMIFLVMLVLCHMVFAACGLYKSRRLSTKFDEAKDILKATAFSSVSFAAIGQLFSVRMLTLPFLLTFWAVSTLVLLLSRATIRAVLAYARVHGRNLRYLLIVGTNPRAVSFAETIAASPERGYRLVGFVDNDWFGMAVFRDSGFDLVCNFDDLAEFLRRNVVDEIVIYVPFVSFYRHWSEVAGLCANHGITVRINSDTFGVENMRLTVEGEDNHFATQTVVGEGWALAVKRSLDIVLSTTLLLLTAPILVGAAIAIKLNSSGPVFFLQERVGLNKRRFKIYKFRTMVDNAEQLIAGLESRNEVTGPVFKIKNDPRLTPIGRFLRRSSIDELPQLLNVLKGDMSLVGPRPLPIRDYEGFSEDWQRRRFSAKPGITCLWQVNGRSGVSFDEWMLLDLQYLDQWSLWLDLKILARTVPAVVRGSGAV